ncbi:MAG: NCS2 family permease [Epulopiscium sp.]|nr:NCS2 family permease [Candidatus Epulonipiscium sp.]
MAQSKAKKGPQSNGLLEKVFKLSQHNTDVKTEVLAGITTFMTMAYILVVNPDILSTTGMEKGAVLTATALGAALGTLMMALLANYPFALAPGMGLNAFFAFSVASVYGWEMALTAILIEGIVFILLSLVNVREAIFDAIPQNMKYAVSVGIGLFITFIGFQNAGIIVSEQATLVTLGNVKSITVVLALVGLILTATLVIKKVKGALLWGILGTYVLGLVCQLTGLYVVNPEIGMFSLIPEGIISAPPSVAPTFAKFSFSKVITLDFIVVIFSFLFVDIFDTIGTLIGVSSKAGFLDKDGKLPKVKEALLADAIGTVGGAILGTSTVTTYVESASGVADGGRTGLTSLTTAVLFAVALIFTPIIMVIPSFATAPVLIIVGLFMMESVTKINFTDYTEGLPAFLTIIMMPLAYSISEGLVFGVISYVLLKLITGKGKNVHMVMYIIAALFILKYIF